MTNTRSVDPPLLIIFNQDNSIHAIKSIDTERTLKSFKIRKRPLKFAMICASVVGG